MYPVSAIQRSQHFQHFVFDHIKNTIFKLKHHKIEYTFYQTWLKQTKDTEF